MAASGARAVQRFGIFLSQRPFCRLGHTQIPILRCGKVYKQHQITTAPCCAAIHSQHPSGKQRPARPHTKYVGPASDEEDYYDVDDDELDDLSQTHREAARSQHKSSEGLEFDSFPLSDQLKSKLTKLGYKEPFEIQAKTLPHTLGDRDVIGRALTGSGKTLAFSIPIVQKMAGRNRGRTKSPMAIVISPTRELCLQIHRSIQELDRSIRCVALYGGDSYYRQETAIGRGIDVVCATPGRLNDHIQRGNINLNEVEFLCLDEADELLTPGFKVQIEDILMKSPKTKQMMLFSATLPPNIKQITSMYMKEPVLIDIAGGQQLSTPLSVKHLCMYVPASQHMAAVKYLIEQHQAERCIVFMSMKVQCNNAAKALIGMGIRAEAIHSDRDQKRRENIMRAFRKGSFNVLVATDVAARGLDIPETDLIIQVEPPLNGIDYYIHRSGRTGRAGRDGVAVLLHSGKGREAIREIERMVKLEKVDGPELSKFMIEDIVRQMKQTRPSQQLLSCVEEMNLTAEQSQEMLIKAFSLLMKGPSEKPSGPRTNNRSNFGHRDNNFGHHRDNNFSHHQSRDNYFGNFGQRNDQHRTNYGRSRSPHRPRQNQFDPEEDM